MRTMSAIEVHNGVTGYAVGLRCVRSSVTSYSGFEDYEMASSSGSLIFRWPSNESRCPEYVRRAEYKLLGL